MSVIDTKDTAALVRLCTLLAVTACVAIVAAAVSIAAAMKEKVGVIGATDSGRFIPVVTLDKPYLTESRVQAFVEECLRRSFSHDFLNFRTTLVESQRCYTPSAAAKFASAIDPMLGDIKQRRMVMTVGVTRPPVVVRAYKKDGVHTWDLEAEITVSLEGTRDRVPPKRFHVTSKVTRVELEQSIKGVLMSNLELSPPKS